MTHLDRLDSVNALFSRSQFVLIAGPCVAESESLCLEIAEYARALAAQYQMGYIFKASFDKANRTSGKSQRGRGLEAGRDCLRAVQEKLQIPTLTDIHLPEQAAWAAEVADVLQIPAFLCRQTDLLHAAAKTGRPVNVKKGQFLAPGDMRHVVEKLRDGGATKVAVTERGTCFGYNNLVVDMRGLIVMREATGAPIIFDATHSVQSPGGLGASSSGDRTLAPPLARAAAAVGVDGLFCEVHPDPDNALSDGPNSLNFNLLAQTVRDVAHIRGALAGSQSWVGAGTLDSTNSSSISR